MSRLCLWCHHFLHIYFLFHYITAAPEHRFTFALIKWHNTSYPRASPTHIRTRRVWTAEQMKVFNWRPRIRCECVPLWCLRNIWAWQGGFWSTGCSGSSLICQPYLWVPAAAAAALPHVQPPMLHPARFVMMSDGPRSLRPRLRICSFIYLRYVLECFGSCAN